MAQASNASPDDRYNLGVEMERLRGDLGQALRLGFLYDLEVCLACKEKTVRMKIHI